MSLFDLRWSKYIPKEKKPTPKQVAFLSLPHLEAFFGGAAGGGKSEALLFAALQYVEEPEYKGIILRRTYQDMQLPSAILQRCKEWLRPFIASGEVKYRPANNHTFKFPSGAELAFGYLQNIGDEKRYQGSEYHFCAFDEVTQFLEEQYTYLFSRLRRGIGNKIPIRMRCASNPGGIGMKWVRDRFEIRYNDSTGQFQGYNRLAPFVPSYYQDNPHINSTEYGTTLDKLSRVEMERLKHGNWDVSEDAIFEKHWFNCRYTTKYAGDYTIYHLNSPDHGLRWYPKDKLFIFTTVDCAASVKTGVNGRSFTKDRQPSWSVISTWGITPDYDLLWLDLDRFQNNIPFLIERIFQNHQKWNPIYNVIEKNGPGEGVCATCITKGLPVNPINTKFDKLMNSTIAQLKAKTGGVWLPEGSLWLKDLEDELFTWTGHIQDVADQIDTLSNAANEASRLAGTLEFDIRLRQGVRRSIPFTSQGLYHTNRRLTAGPRRTIEPQVGNINLMLL